MTERRGLRNLSKIGFIVSLVWIAASILWFHQYWDPSQAVLYVLFGFGGVLLSIVYEWIVRMKMDLQEMDKSLSSMASYIGTKPWEQK